MNVKELINLLETYGDDLPVRFCILNPATGNIDYYDVVDAAPEDSGKDEHCLLDGEKNYDL